HSQTDQKIHLRRELQEVQPCRFSRFNEIREINVCGDVLLAYVQIWIFHQLVPPVAHERALRTCIEFTFKIAIIDCEMEATLDCSSNAAHPRARLKINVSKIAFRNRSFDRGLEVAFDFREVFRYVDFP